MMGISNLLTVAKHASAPDLLTTQPLPTHPTSMYLVTSYLILSVGHTALPSSEPLFEFPSAMRANIKH